MGEESKKTKMNWASFTS